MKTILSLVLFLVIGILGSRGLVSRARFKLPVVVLFLTGIEFFFLGVLLGPSFLNLISHDVLQELKPIAYLALGWAGLLFGIQLQWRNLRVVSTAVYRVLVIEGLVVIAVGMIVYFGLLRLLYRYLAPTEIVLGAALLAITSSITSPTIIALLAQRLPSRGRFTKTVRIVSSLGSVVPLFAFGLLFTVAHPGFFASGGVGAGALWWLFANIVGVALGFVMVFLSIQRSPKDERLLLIAGTVILVGGLCYLLSLSALYTAMIMGIVVGNFARRKQQIYEQLHELERTVYVAFLILIGAHVSFGDANIIYLVLVYVAVRLLLKVFVSGWILERSFRSITRIKSAGGLALSAQGGMALAVALDYRQGTSGELVEVVVATIAIAVVANEIIGVALTRRAFRASGEIVARAAPAPPDAGDGK